MQSVWFRPVICVLGTTFTGGATAGIDADNEDPCGLAVSPDGSSIFLAGTANIPTGGTEIAVARFTAAGALVSGFGDGGAGVVKDNFGSHPDNHATAVALSGNNIVVAGYSESNYLDLLCYSQANGSLDQDFGTGGRVFESIPAGYVSSLAIQPDGMILVGGALAGAGDFGVARFYPLTGSLDGNFGSSGIATSSIGNGSVAGLAVQPDGSIVAAGYAGNAFWEIDTSSVPVLDRLTIGGNSVIVNGVTSPLPLSGSSTVTADSRYTLTFGDGWADLGSGAGVTYDIHWGDGSPDTFITADELAAQDDQVTHVFAVAAPLTGTTVTDEITVDLDVPGTAPYTDVGGPFPVAVDMTDATTTTLAVTPPSPSFGQSVTLTATVSVAVSATGAPSGTVEFYDGTIDLGPGNLNWNTTASAYVATLTTPLLTLGDHGFTAVYSGDGTFDPSTSPAVVASVTSGVALTLTGQTTSVNEGSAYSLTLPTTAGGYPITQWTINWGDGSAPMVVDGNPSTQTYVYEAPGDYPIQAIATANGQNYSAALNNDVASALDTTTFGTNGTIDAGAGSISSLAVQPDGEIVAIQSSVGVTPALFRYDDTGTADGTTFDDVSSQIPNVTAVVVQPQPGGFDIVVAGLGIGGSGFTVARYNSDGSLDTTFGNDGTASIGTWTNPPSDLLVQPDGDIVLVGIEPDGGSGDELVVARFLPDGQRDPNFGSGGYAIHDFHAPASSCDAVIQTGNQIVAAVGFSASTEVLRFTSTGGPDPGFGPSSNGILTVGAFSSPALATQAAGEIDLAGDVSNNLTLLRYSADGKTLESTSTGAANLAPAALAIQPGGRIVALDSVLGQTNTWALSAFDQNGTLDGCFNALTLGLSGTSAAMAVQPEGKIVLAGTSAADPTDAYFARYTSDGLDAQVASAALGTLTGVALQTQVGNQPVNVTSYSFGDNVNLTGSFSGPGSQEACNVVVNWEVGNTQNPDITDYPLAPGQTTFSIPAQQYAANGTYTINVTVENAYGDSNTQSIADVVYTNALPSALSLSLDQPTIYAGNQTTFSGSFTGPQSNFTHSVTIDWNSVGAPGTDTTTLQLSAGETSFQTDPHTYTTAGNYTISVVIAGPDGNTTATTPVAVNSTTTVVSPPTSPTYGQSVTLSATVASVVTGNGTPTGTVDFYDQTTGTDLGTASLSSGVGTLLVSGLAVGAHAITATYSGDNNFPASQSNLSVTVAGGTLSLANVTVDNVAAGATVNKGDIATLSGDVANLDGMGFSVTVTWATGDSATIAYPAGTTSFTLSHQYVDGSGAFAANNYSVAVSLTSSDNRTTSTSTNINLVDVAPTVSIAGAAGDPGALSGILPYQAVELSAVVADPGEYGSFTYSWTVTGGGVSSTSGNTSATFNFTPTSDANYAVSLTVTDADGKTASADVTIYRGGSGGSGGCSPVGLGGGLRNGPDSPTVTIQECNSQGNPNPSPVLAGSAAYFLVSVGGNEPNHGTVTLSDDTQNGSDDANSDYTGTVGTLTFSFNSSLNGGHGGYAPQMITVNTSPTADSGNFSMDIPCLYDPYASIPGSSSPPSNQSPPVASATAYITAPACSVSLTIPQSENTNPLVNVGSSMSGSTLTGYATQLEAVQVTVSIQGNDFVPGQYAVQLDGGGAEIFSDPQGNDQISGFFIESPSDLTRTVYVVSVAEAARANFARWP